MEVLLNTGVRTLFHPLTVIHMYIVKHLNYEDAVKAI